MENNNTNSNKLYNETKTSSIYLKLLIEYSDIDLNIPTENINKNIFKYK